MKDNKDKRDKQGDQSDGDFDSESISTDSLENILDETIRIGEDFQKQTLGHLSKAVFTKSMKTKMTES